MVFWRPVREKISVSNWSAAQKTLPTPALVNPHLSYGLACWSNVTKTSLKKIIILQNKIVRLMTYSDQRTPASGLYKSLQILALNNMIKLTLIAIAHSFHHKTLPKIFDNLFKYLKTSHSYNAWIRSNQNFFEPAVNTNVGKNEFIIDEKKCGSLLNWISSCWVPLVFEHRSKNTFLIVINKHNPCGLDIHYYMTSFALSRYHIWITCGLLLNVICSTLNKPMRWPPGQEDVSFVTIYG